MYNDYEPRLKPYGFVGLGVFHFDPMGSLTSANGLQTWYRLQPLRTEGQGMTEYPNRKIYNLTQLNIPMGGGLKYEVSDRINVGFELLYRKTFTDYIDDVSTKYIDPIYFSQYLAPADVPVAYQLHNREPFRNITRPTIGRQRGDSKEMDSYFSTIIRFGWRLNGSNSPNRKALRQLRCPLYF